MGERIFLHVQDVHVNVGAVMKRCFVACRADHVHLPGDADPAETQRVLHGPTAREGGVWDVLPGRRAVSQLLLALPHRVLPLRESVSHLLQVRLQLSWVFT